MKRDCPNEVPDDKGTGERKIPRTDDNRTTFIAVNGSIDCKPQAVYGHIHPQNMQYMISNLSKDAKESDLSRIQILICGIVTKHNILIDISSAVGCKLEKLAVDAIRLDEPYGLAYFPTDITKMTCLNKAFIQPIESIHRSLVEACADLNSAAQYKVMTLSNRVKTEFMIAILKECITTLNNGEHLRDKNITIESLKSVLDIQEKYLTETKPIAEKTIGIPSSILLKFRSINIEFAKHHTHMLYLFSQDKKYIMELRSTYNELCTLCPSLQTNSDMRRFMLSLINQWMMIDDINKYHKLFLDMTSFVIVTYTNLHVYQPLVVSDA